MDTYGRSGESKSNTVGIPAPDILTVHEGLKTITTWDLVWSPQSIKSIRNAEFVEHGMVPTVQLTASARAMQ